RDPLNRSTYVRGRHIESGCHRLCLRVRAVRARLRDCHLIVHRVDLNQHSTFLDILVVLNVKTYDMSANASADRIDVAVDLRVISRLVAREISPNQNSADHDDQSRKDKAPFRAWIAQHGCPAFVVSFTRLRGACLRGFLGSIALLNRCISSVVHRFHFPFMYSLTPSSARPIALAKETFARLCWYKLEMRFS